MAKLILEKENGERILIRDDLPEYASKHNIFYGGDYLAMKLWVKDDIRNELICRGYEGTQDEIDAVVNTGYLKLLNDCTDYDWWCIDYAIDSAIMLGHIKEEDEK